MKKLLIIVDMINGFVKEGALADNYINHITKDIKKKIEEFQLNKDEIISMQEGHTTESREFINFPPHCILGTDEAELIEELMPYQNTMKTIRKNSTSGIFAQEFMDYLESNINSINEVVIVGCCTDICIMNLAIPLKNFFNEHNLEIKVTVPRECVETYELPNHNRNEYNEIAFKLMKQNGINIED